MEYQIGEKRQFREYLVSIKDLDALDQCAVTVMVMAHEGKDAETKNEAEAERLAIKSKDNVLSLSGNSMKATCEKFTGKQIMAEHKITRTSWISVKTISERTEEIDLENYLKFG